jgi:hypothetical protein
VHGLRECNIGLEKSFLTQPMEHLGDVGHLESCVSPFVDGISVGTR